MPIIYQHRIYRIDLRANPFVYYVFGDNTIRKGLGGQAGEMRGEANAIGVATKWYPTEENKAYFSDDDYDIIIKDVIDPDFVPIETALKEGALVVIPNDGLGTGLSRLPELAPKLDEYIKEKITTLNNTY